MRVVSDCVGDGAPRTSGGQGLMLVAPGSHYSRNGEGEAPGFHYNGNGEGEVVNTGTISRNEHGLKSAVQSPLLQNIRKHHYHRTLAISTMVGAAVSTMIDYRTISNNASTMAIIAGVKVVDPSKWEVCLGKKQ